MLPLVHMTAAYSNAMLVAILPHISDCAKQLDMPIPQPITASHVARFSPSPFKGAIGGAVWLTNQYWFVFNNGFVRGYRCPDDWFTMADEYWDHLERYVGQDNMTTNEAIELARDSFRKLGYKLEDFGVDGPPTHTIGPDDDKKLGHIPYLSVEWNSPESKVQHMLGSVFNIRFDISLQQKRVVGISLISQRFFRPDPKVDIVPELESDYQKRVKARMVAGTNRSPAETPKVVPSSELFIHITADYSNAMLCATLPLVSDFARKLGLQVAQPVTMSQVVASHPSDIKDVSGDVLILTNHYWFMMANGYVGAFSSPNNWFDEKGTRTDWPRYSGKDCLTTNEAIELARETLRKLGDPPKDWRLDGPPTDLENAVEDQDSKGETRFAFCRVTWDSPDREHGEGIQFDIDLRRKQVVGMVLVSTNFWRPSPKTGVASESESAYRKRNQVHLFVRTNAPPHWPSNQVTNAPPAISPAGEREIKKE